MKKYHKITLFLAICFIFVISIHSAKAVEKEAEARLNVTEAALGTGVENRVPVGTGDAFNEGSRVYFFTWVVGGDAEDHVTHVWIREEEEKFRIDLNIGGPSWRTWSYKTMHPGSVGNWTVEARDGEGNVLESMSFECIAQTSQ